MLAEWAALNLVVHNAGKIPTFYVPGEGSFVDVTLSMTTIAKYIENWRELSEEENLNDHHHIL